MFANICASEVFIILFRIYAEFQTVGFFVEHFWNVYFVIFIQKRQILSDIIWIKLDGELKLIDRIEGFFGDGLKCDNKSEFKFCA